MSARRASGALALIAPEGDLGPEDEPTLIDDPKGPEIGAEGVPRVVAGIMVDELPLCRAGCGFRMLKRSEWRRLPREDVARLRSLNVRRTEAQQICGGCYSKAHKAGTLSQFPRIVPENASVRKRFDVPALWEQVRAAEGGYLELGNELGVSREFARQLVKELGLPTVDRRVNEERDYFISETEYLIQCGLGVHEIARSFGLSDDEFVVKIGRLRERGLTAVRFDEYLEVAA